MTTPSSPTASPSTASPDHRDHRAAHYAKQIDGACDDIIKDSWWEHFSDEVGDVLNNRWVSDIFNALGIIVSVIGIIALFCTPAGWIITACTVIGVALAAKDVLAALTGNGSWFDVGMDAVGFLGGFAFGRALKALSTIRAAAKVAAEGAAAEQATTQVMRDSENVFDDTYRTTRSRTASRAAKAQANQTRNAIRGQAADAGNAARAAESARPAPEPTPWDKFTAGGDDDLAGDSKDVADMRARFPDSQAVQQASQHAGAIAGTARGIYAGNTALGLGGQALGLSQASSLYNRLEDRYTVAIGSQW